MMPRNISAECSRTLMARSSGAGLELRREISSMSVRAYTSSTSSSRRPRRMRVEKEPLAAEIGLSASAWI